LFVSSCLLAWISGKIAFGVSSIQLLTLGVVAIIFLVYGVCAAVLLTRFERSLGERG
jgi:membrane protein implicated in regulation of membrane protease activity